MDPWDRFLLSRRRFSIVDYVKVMMTPRARRIFFGVFVMVVLGYALFISAPDDFPHGITVEIEEGATLSDISGLLYSTSIIRSKFFFEMAVTLLRGDRGAILGDYFFSVKENGIMIAYRVAYGKFNVDSVRVTLPEGLSAEEFAVLLKEKLYRFDEALFLRLAKTDEGYLFPDTYFFWPWTKAPEVYLTLKKNFEKKIASLNEDVRKSGRSLNDIVIMASLLEREARTEGTRRTIAGILWERLSIGMPLQVDAVFEYIIGKNTYQLTTEDLKIDSPYNTYKHKGLPVGPIGNPGLDSIRAALNPTESPYLYYLSDREGNIYYSRMFEEHAEKKAKYIQ